MPAPSSPVIALALCTDWPEPTIGEIRYVEALRDQGATVRWAPWTADDQSVFRTADLVVLRGTWDYHRRLNAYRGWLRGLAAAGVRVANPIGLVEWNLDKAYLDELAAGGIRTPGQAVLPLDRLALAALMDERGWGEAVVKPTAGASGHGVRLVARGDIDALWPEIAESVAPHRLLVQEFIGAVRTSGQISFIFFDGIFSHAAQLIPRAGEFRINSAFQPEKRACIPAPGELAQASSVLEKLPERPLYARIDGIFDGPDFVLLEAEVNEPGLFLDLDPQAAMRFAAASLAWLAR
ncbi:RimK family alpha-L-glutamate ligase [Oceanibaculum nanhaiense]|uniref:ATP-grasp domain-containing protein n=1 Tax=Oceanibaculum nanhaiense TaxID=1909734 RepID=UPI00396D9CEC